MLRIVITILCMAILDRASSQMKYGLKAGTNLSNIVIEGDHPFKGKFGPYAGFIIQIPFHKKINFQTEIIYSQKGYKFPKGLPYSGKLNLHYINVPLLTKFQAINNLSFSLGPEFGYLLKEEYKMKTGTEFAKSFQKFDLSLNIGAAYQLLKGLGIEIRYDYGLIKVARGILADSNGNIIGYKKIISNRTFQFGIFYQINK